MYFAWTDSRNGDFDIYASIIQYNDPGLIPDPAVLNFAFEQGGPPPAPQAVSMINAGLGEINWRAVPEVDWAVATPSSGITPGGFMVGIITDSLSCGEHYGQIRLIDDDNNDSTTTVMIQLNITAPVLDTIQFFNTNAMPGQTAVMPVYIYLHQPIKVAYIPFAYDCTTATLDSIIIDTALMPSCLDFYTACTIPGQGEIGWRVRHEMIDDSALAPGTYNICYLFFTAVDTGVFNHVDTLTSDSSGVYFLNSLLQPEIPIVIAGDLAIGNPTGVSDDDPPFQKSAFDARNYPNPFNAVTNIAVNLPQTALLEIDIFNILGQKVKSLPAGFFSPGQYVFNWDGRMDNLLSAPSGIYFCRLSTSNSSRIIKMVLVE